MQVSNRLLYRRRLAAFSAPHSPSTAYTRVRRVKGGDGRDIFEKGTRLIRTRQASPQAAAFTLAASDYEPGNTRSAVEQSELSAKHARFIRHTFTSEKNKDDKAGASFEFLR